MKKTIIKIVVLGTGLIALSITSVLLYISVKDSPEQLSFCSNFVFPPILTIIFKAIDLLIKIIDDHNRNR